MRVKLIQRKVIGSADCVQRLDFSVLTGQGDWSVAVDFGYGNETIAEIIWIGSASYSIWTEWRGKRTDYGIINCHSHIIPTIIYRLSRLFHRKGISDMRHPQPIVRVAPIDT
jgi:hypothetical protein